MFVGLVLTLELAPAILLSSTRAYERASDLDVEHDLDAELENEAEFAGDTCATTDAMYRVIATRISRGSGKPSGMISTMTWRRRNDQACQVDGKECDLRLISERLKRRLQEPGQGHEPNIDHLHHTITAPQYRQKNPSYRTLTLYEIISLSDFSTAHDKHSSLGLWSSSLGIVVAAASRLVSTVVIPRGFLLDAAVELSLGLRTISTNMSFLLAIEAN